MPLDVNAARYHPVACERPFSFIDILPAGRLNWNCSHERQSQPPGIVKSLRCSLEKQIHFANGSGEKLSGTLHLPQSATGRGVVLGHCFTCSQHTGILRQLGRELAAEGFATLRFDFSGNGQSEGVFAESPYSKQVDDMMAGMDILAEKGASWIAMAGHSMGALIAVLAAARSTKIKAVAALSGRLSGTNARRLFSETQLTQIQETGRVSFTSRGRSLEMTDTFFSDADRFDLPGTLSSFAVPLLIVHGNADEIVPVEEAFEAQALNPDGTELAIIHGADHMFSKDADRRRVSSTVVDWLTRQ